MTRTRKLGKPVGYFEFEEDCVGAEIQFHFRGQRYLICLPNFDFNKPDGFGHPTPSLKGTRVKLAWLTGKSDDHIFGREHSRDPKNKKVLRFTCNQLIVRSSGLATADIARKAKTDLLLWRDIFAKWWEVIGYDDLEGSNTYVEQKDSLECYFIYAHNSRKTRRIKSKGENRISIVATMANGFNLTHVKRALKYAAHGKEPPGHYVLLIDALKHYNQKKYRQSILDSATAIEMALTLLLESRLANHSSLQRKLIFDKYKQIGGLTSALKQLGHAIPSDIGTKIGTPRNQAIHKGREIKKEEAREALEVARTFIYGNFVLR